MKVADYSGRITAVFQKESEKPIHRRDAGAVAGSGAGGGQGRAATAASPRKEP